METITKAIKPGVWYTHINRPERLNINPKKAIKIDDLEIGRIYTIRQPKDNIEDTIVFLGLGKKMTCGEANNIFCICEGVKTNIWLHETTGWLLAGHKRAQQVNKVEIMLLG